MRTLSNHLLTSRMQTFSKKYWYQLCWQLWETLEIAANEAFNSEVVETGMLPLELEDCPHMSEKEYREEWTKAKIDEWMYEE